MTLVREKAPARPLLATACAEANATYGNGMAVPR